MSDRPLPLLDESSGPFWEACARGELVIQRCVGCATFRHPPRPMCPRCNAFGYYWTAASGRGRVWSWVIAHPPVLPAFADKVPYNVAVIELEEGVRMVGTILGSDFTVGTEVRVEFEDIGEGVKLPQWRPILSISSIHEPSP